MKHRKISTLSGTFRLLPVFSFMLVLLFVLSACGAPEGDWGAWASESASPDSAGTDGTAEAEPEPENTEEVSYTMDTIPDYFGQPWVVIDNNQPDFDNDLKATTDSFEYYGDLDYLARCTACEANIGTDLMPTDDRGSISSVHPSGWIQAKYDCISGKDLYNRCHLIGYQLTGENANPNNLITGTRYLNIDGMLPFEDLVADYVKETENHVLYLVTPVFEGDELVARGVHMEGWSVEDEGDGVCFNVYCYNVQPGIEIDYASGASRLADADSIYAIDSSTVSTTTEADAAVTTAGDAEAPENAEADTDETAAPAEAAEVGEAGAADQATHDDHQAEAVDAGAAGEDHSEQQDYVLNTKTMKFHKPSCSSVSKLSDANREERCCTREELIEEGYTPCGSCKP